MGEMMESSGKVRLSDDRWIIFGKDNDSPPKSESEVNAELDRLTDEMDRLDRFLMKAQGAEYKQEGESPVDAVIRVLERQYRSIKPAAVSVRPVSSEPEPGFVARLNRLEKMVQNLCIQFGIDAKRANAPVPDPAQLQQVEQKLVGGVQDFLDVLNRGKPGMDMDALKKQIEETAAALAAHKNGAGK